MTPMAQRGLVNDEAMTKQIIAQPPEDGRIGPPQEWRALLLALLMQALPSRPATSSPSMAAAISEARAVAQPSVCERAVTCRRGS